MSNLWLWIVMAKNDEHCPDVTNYVDPMTCSLWVVLLQSYLEHNDILCRASVSLNVG